MLISLLNNADHVAHPSIDKIGAIHRAARSHIALRLLCVCGDLVVGFVVVVLIGWWWWFLYIWKCCTFTNHMCCRVCECVRWSIWGLHFG